MKTVTVDLIDDKAIDLLKDLEALNIIRIQDKDEEALMPINSFTKYKGRMSKQTIEEIDKQLNELRNDWE